jgi:hypothetical protein
MGYGRSLARPELKAKARMAHWLPTTNLLRDDPSNAGTEVAKQFAERPGSGHKRTRQKLTCCSLGSLMRWWRSGFRVVTLQREVSIAGGNLVQPSANVVCRRIRPASNVGEPVPG